MDSIELSIVIPTYNREKNLQKTLEILEQQSFDSVEVIVFDNASDYDLSMLKTQYKNRTEIRFFRNEVNVGLYANLFRAVEQARGRYVWTLGDDDLPSMNAIRTIRDRVHNTHRAVGFKFSSHLAQHRDEWLTDLHQMQLHISRDWRYFSNLLFISSLVVHRATYLKFMRHGYNSILSNYAHVVPLLLAIDEGNALCTCSDSIIDGSQKVDATWAPGVVYMTLLTGSRLILGNPSVNFSKLIQNVVTRDGSIVYMVALLLRIHFTLEGENRKNYVHLFGTLSLKARLIWIGYQLLRPLLSQHRMPWLIKKLKLGDVERT